MEYLDGGRSNKIARINNQVHRPAGAWTPHIHNLLKHLRLQGFAGAPEPIGFTAEGLPLHLVCGVSLPDVMVIITVYRPHPGKWFDWRIRKESV